MLCRTLSQPVGRAGLFGLASQISRLRSCVSAPSPLNFPSHARVSPCVSSGPLEKFKLKACLHDSIGVGELEMSLNSMKLREGICLPYAMNFSRFIHSGKAREVEAGANSNSMDFLKGILEENGKHGHPQFSERPLMDSRLGPQYSGRQTDSGLRPQFSGKPMGFGGGRTSRPMDFVRGIIEEHERDMMGFSHSPRNQVEQNADIVHVKLMRNNTYVTVTDSKGNKKFGISSGCLAEKGGPKVSRYAAEATAEHIGRMARERGLKSVVMKVNGFTFFKKKKQAVLSFRDGYTYNRGDQNPVVYIEDTTRRPHNGCRLRKRRRV